MSQVINPKLVPLLPTNDTGAYAVVSRVTAETVTLEIDPATSLNVTVERANVVFKDPESVTTTVKTNMYNQNSYWYFNDAGELLSVITGKKTKAAETPKTTPSTAGRGCTNPKDQTNW
jgi:hypothetical protein